MSLRVPGVVCWVWGAWESAGRALGGLIVGGEGRWSGRDGLARVNLARWHHQPSVSSSHHIQVVFYNYAHMQHSPNLSHLQLQISDIADF